MECASHDEVFIWLMERGLGVNCECDNADNGPVTEISRVTHPLQPAQKCTIHDTPSRRRNGVHCTL